jgi:Acetyl-CoA dehydrogenase C-terminal like/Acyl-CoA dehydrogenase, C-terminal domain
MNGARLGVGNQSLGLTQVAYENAVAYAKDRVQMRSLSGPKRPDLAADPIIVHPDVRKMLLTARAYAEGARALVYFVAIELDKSHNHPDEAVRKESDDTVALLTPIVKAFITDNALISTVHCQQVFGGHGYIHEWGMEQFVRDSRINMIYEGTNTVQSLDLLGRKVLGDAGAKLTKFGKLVGRFVKENADNEAMQEFTKPLGDLGTKVQAFTMEIGMKGMGNPDEVGAAAVDYLRVVGHLVYAYFFARAAKIALEKQGSGDPFYKAKLATARFYFAKLLPEVETAMITAKAGLAPLMEMDEALF